MNYVECPPGGTAARLVERYWHLHGASNGQPEWVLPDGRPELIFHLGATFTRHDAEGRAQAQADVLVAGQMLEPIGLSCAGEACVIGVRFRPAALRALCGVDAEALTGEIVDARSVLPAAVVFRADLGAAFARGGFDAAVAALDAFVQRIVTAEVTDVVSRACDAILTDGGISGVDALADALGLSRRQLERMFAREVGLTPKAFARVIRFHRAAQSLASGRALAEVALECGYYDQAHMALDFRQLAAASPGAWRKAAPALASAFLHGGVRDIAGT